MLHRDITVAVDIDAYGIAHLHYDCAVAVSEINSTIEELQSALSPFNPAKLIQISDVLYYQLVDHSTDQEIDMMRDGFHSYSDQRDLHTDMLELLTASDHRQLFNDEITALDYVNQLIKLSKAHLNQEAEFSRFKEAQRFRR